MRKQFEAELLKTKGLVLDLAEETMRSISMALECVYNSNAKIADDIIRRDDIIDSKSIELEEQLISFLAKQQPVARDLRRIIAYLRICESLERMGDLAEHMAYLCKNSQEAIIKDSLKDLFSEFGNKITKLIEEIAPLLKNSDLEIAISIKKQDENIDKLYKQILTKLINSKDLYSPKDVLQISLAARYYERIADHAVKIAKKIVYLATGEW